MKNSKRLAAFLLVAALMAGLFAGCGSTEGEQATDAPGQEAASASPGASSILTPRITTRRHSALLRSSGAWTPPPAR